MNNIHFITLGCSKNDVDTSQMKSLLNDDKYEVVENPKDADVIVVNTCGFIDAAKEESIDTIIEAATYKENGHLKKLLLAGCLAQRYSKELIDEIPEIDGIIGTGGIGNLNEALDLAFLDKNPVLLGDINELYIEKAYKKDVLTTEYVKISEGCNNNCTYCIIPKLRGKNRSRKIEDIYNEVEYLVNNGTKEVILIAQNTTDYGIDIYGEYKLDALISELSKIEDLKWIRVMYLYPDHFTEGLINEFKNNNKLLKYVDIPLQHISNNVLKSMNRHTDKNSIMDLLFKLKNEIEGIVIRTTFIVGFPGETDEDFIELKDFIQQIKFDKLGVFNYSREEDTPAFLMDNQVDDEIKEERNNIIMDLQMKVSEEILNSKIDGIYNVLIEEQIDEFTYSGRTYMDAPEIDGVVYVSGENLSLGEFYKVRINDSLEYDLIGEII